LSREFDFLSEDESSIRHARCSASRMNFSFKKIQKNLYILCVRKLTPVTFRNNSATKKAFLKKRRKSEVELQLLLSNLKFYLRSKFQRYKRQKRSTFSIFFLLPEFCTPWFSFFDTSSLFFIAAFDSIKTFLLSLKFKYIFILFCQYINLIIKRTDLFISRTIICDWHHHNFLKCLKNISNKIFNDMNN